MDKEITDKIMFDNFLKSVPTMVVDAKDRKTISAYESIDVNDLMSAIDRLDKVPTYDKLLRENKQLKEVIDKAIEYINENVYEEDNGCGDHWWEIANKGELLKILENKEVSE